MKGSPWQAVAALACVLLDTFLMNNVVFPLFDDLFTYARDISQTVQALSLVLFGVVATFRPRLLEKAHLAVVTATTLVVGVASLPISLAFSSPILLVLSSSVFAFARGAVLLFAGLAAARALKAESVPSAVAVAFVAATACHAICWIVPTFVGLALFLLLPIIAFALSVREGQSVLECASASEAPADMVVTRPSSFLPLASQFFVCLFLFRVAFGYSLRFGEDTGVPVAVFAMVLPVAAAAVLLVVWSRFDADVLTGVSVVFVAAGFFFVNATDGAVRDLSNVLLASGNSLFNMVSWIVLITLGGRNLAGAPAVVGWGNGVGAFGTLVGAALGVESNRLFERDASALMMVSGILLVLFVGYALIGLKKFSFKETIEGIVPSVPDMKAESPEEQFEERCRRIGEACRLTPRELEVFEMLARGRNREYIQEKLVVSRNTVKAHVRHVYEKLGIHSHQELIDLVEADCPDGRLSA